MWESTGNGYNNQPNCPYRDPPSQPNVCDGFIHNDKESEQSVNEKDDPDWQ